MARYGGDRDISEKNFAGARATRGLAYSRTCGWSHVSKGRLAGGRGEEQQRSAGQGLAGHHKDFGFFLQATRSHRSVLSRGGRDLTLIFPTERNLVTK